MEENEDTGRLDPPAQIEKEICPICQGDGDLDGERCFNCKGQGEINA
jgi:DnaJ-class molecular chaperone